MAGLLGNGWDDPQSSANMALAAGLLRGDFGGGLLGANQAYQGAQDATARRGLLGLQAQEGALRLKQLQQQVADDDAARSVLRGAYGSVGMPGSTPRLGTGAAGVLDTSLPPEQRMPSMPALQPQATGATGGVTPKADVWGQYKAIGDQMAAAGLMEKAQQYYGLAEKFRPKYATTPQQMMVGGKLTNVLVGEDGTVKALDGYGVKPEMVEQDLGGVKQWVDKNSLQPGQTFTKTMSPGEVASNRLGWANYGVSRDRLNFDRAGGGAPSGYRYKADGSGLEPIPGGPADPNTPKSKANLTEDQGKATGWLVQAENAWKNMQAVGVKDGKVTDAAKPGFNDVLASSGPFGEAAANKMRLPDRQKYMQASSSLSEALLRAATGAGVNKEEAAQKIKELTPVYGDSDEVIKQKMDAVPLYLESLRVRAGPGAVKADAISASQPGAASRPSVVKTGMYGGRRVQQMSDGSVRYAD